MKKMTLEGVEFAFEQINPTTAGEMLKRNKKNRPFKEPAIAGYALDMKKGHWLTNHQGIAFDAEQNLMDGQNRLQAIIASGQTIKVLVTRGWPVESNNGIQIFTQDTVDRNKPRSVADQLVLRHDYKNATLVAASCAVIGEICTGRRIKLSTPTSINILDIYGKEITFAIEHRSNERGIRVAAVCAATAFAIKSDSARVKEFYTLLVSGEGIFKTGATAPIYALRRCLIGNIQQYGGNVNIVIASHVLNALRYWILGEEITMLKSTSLGVEFFCNRQKSNVQKMTEMLAM